MFFSKPKEVNEIENKIVNNIKSLTLDIINNNEDGNLDLSLNLSEVIYTLFSKHLKFNRQDPSWINRDRIIVCDKLILPLIKATTFISGYPITLDDLKDNVNLNIPCINNVDYRYGVGLGNAIGSSIVETFLENKYKIINYHTYVILNNIDLDKGNTYEALAYIGENNIKNITIIFDQNTHAVINKTINYEKYFEALGFNVINTVNDDLNLINDAFNKVKESTNPSIIIVNNNKELNFSKNYYEKTKKLDKNIESDLKQELDVRNIPFTVTNEVLENMVGFIDNRMNPIINNFNKEYEKFVNKEELDKIINRNLDIDNIDINYENSLDDTLIDVNNKVLDYLLNNNNIILLNTIFNEYKEVNNSKNLKFKTNLIGNIENGINLDNIRCISINSLNDSDNIIESINYASVNKLNNIYIFIKDKDSNNNSKINNLRNILNVNLFIPNDINELIGTYKFLATNKDNPICIILSSDLVNNKENTSINDIKKGAYIVDKEDKFIQAIILSNGKELDIALDINKKLKEKGYDLRIVSIPSLKLFDSNKDEYKEDIIPFGNKVIVIENSSSNIWYKYVYNKKYIFTPDTIKWYKNESNYEEFIERLQDQIENLIS